MNKWTCQINIWNFIGKLNVLIVIRDYFPLSFTKFYSVLSLGVMDPATSSWRWLFITGVQLWQHSCLLPPAELCSLLIQACLFVQFIYSVSLCCARSLHPAHHTTVSSVCSFLAPSKEISTTDRAAEPTAQSGSVSMTCASLELMMCEGWILTLRKLAFTFSWHMFIKQIFFYYERLIMTIWWCLQSPKIKQ